MPRLAALLCVLTVVVAGCTGSPPVDGSTTTPTVEPTTTTQTATTTSTSTPTRTTRPTIGPNETIGFVEAKPVADVPANATVMNVSHPAIANVTPIQTVVREAVRNDSTATADFTRRENAAVSAAFDRIPRHRSGWYVRFDGQVVQLWYAVQ